MPGVLGEALLCLCCGGGCVYVLQFTIYSDTCALHNRSFTLVAVAWVQSSLYVHFVHLFTIWPDGHTRSSHPRPPHHKSIVLITMLSSS